MARGEPLELPARGGPRAFVGGVVLEKVAGDHDEIDGARVVAVNVNDAGECAAEVVGPLLGKRPEPRGDVAEVAICEMKDPNRHTVRPTSYWEPE